MDWHLFGSPSFRSCRPRSRGTRPLRTWSCHSMRYLGSDFIPRATLGVTERGEDDGLRDEQGSLRRRVRGCQQERVGARAPRADARQERPWQGRLPRGSHENGQAPVGVREPGLTNPFHPLILRECELPTIRDAFHPNRTVAPTRFRSFSKIPTASGLIRREEPPLGLGRNGPEREFSTSATEVDSTPAPARPRVASKPTPP